MVGLLGRSVGVGCLMWGVVGLVLGGCRPPPAPENPRAPLLMDGPLLGQPDPSNELRPPPELRSQGGVLDISLHARYMLRPMRDGQAWVRSYEGLPVGPTLRLRPGDLLKVDLVNEMPATRASAPGHGAHMGHNDPNAKMTPPSGFNITNLHTHGLWVSPSGNSDNVLISVHPGERFQYEIQVPPDHSPGTHWYHPHHHGSVALQVASGMAGMVIIEGGLDDVPEIKAAKEQVLVFQQIAAHPEDCLDEDQHTVLPEGRDADAGCVESYRFFAPGRWFREDFPTTINGQVAPVIKMRPGELQRWRMVHAGVRESIDVAIYPEDSIGRLPRAPLAGEAVRRWRTEQDRRLPTWRIAEDGIAYGRMDRVYSTELEPAYRADLLVKIDQPGRYALIDEARPAGSGLHPEDEGGQGISEPSHIIGWIEVAGDVVDMPLPKPEALTCLSPYRHVEDREITSCQSTQFMVGPGIFTVNGRAFSTVDPTCKLPLGEAQEWHVRSTAASHPFHIHVNPFEVLRPGALPVWKDTYLVRGIDTRDPRDPPVVLRTRYRRFTGEFVMHCHILDHEDQGMMQSMEVVEGAPPPGPSAETGCVASQDVCPFPVSPGPDLSWEETWRAACGP